MIREQLLNPDPAALAAFITCHASTCDCLIQVAGEAEVTYAKRAASTAEAGTYLLFLRFHKSWSEKRVLNQS